MKKLAVTLSILMLAGLSGFAQDDALPTANPADAAAIQKINSLGGGAMPLAANTNLISVNFSLAGAKIDDAALESLKGVADQLVWLNLAGTGVTDAGLKALAGLKNLRRLHLEKTGVGDDGLAALKGLAELQYLNLYSTKVGDKGLSQLSGLKKLKNIYLWQTQVTDAGAGELAKALPGVNINRGIEAPLKPVEPPPAAPAATAKAINAKCPLTGKDIDAAQSVTYKGQVIGFCCPNCKGKFEAEPAKFIGKVAEFKEPAAAPAATAKAINAKCPLTGKDIDAAQTFTYQNQVIGFCCVNCKGKFEKEPEKYIAKVAEFKKQEKKEEKKPEPKKDDKKAEGPVNKKCPVSDEDIDAKVTVTYKGALIAFCCKDCLGTFNKEPAKFEAKIPELKKKAAGKAINTKCPLAGKDINPEATFVYKDQTIAFCCNNCKGKFEKEPEKYISKVAEFKDPAKK